MRRFLCLTISLSCLTVLSMEAIANGADQPARQTVAWGTPRDGLQAGLRVVVDTEVDDQGRPVAIGSEPLQLEPVLRNVSGRPIRLSYLPPDGFAYSNDAKTVIIAVPHARAEAPKVAVTLAPLETHHIGDRPKVNSAIDSRPFWIDSGAGLRHVGAMNVLNEEEPLNTGFIDVLLTKN